MSWLLCHLSDDISLPFYRSPNLRSQGDSAHLFSVQLCFYSFLRSFLAILRRQKLHLLKSFFLYDFGKAHLTEILKQCMEDGKRVKLISKNHCPQVCEQLQFPLSSEAPPPTCPPLFNPTL